ncbi:hypothetical protein N7474_009104 [Penicillium riverlandense]|uniref:uncharacterized protein n=1 Tax=Penicillium riverlandense TaxID=1903569 RepID=UPI002546B6F8|nr:uncharacterized protein N7474_009104 [Penicillium riverlandense]KAJ5807835.1 hypothetical protein N7474_009104 [Penicillium riverlandense]
MFLPSLTIGLLAASASLANAVELTGYEYVVVGSGAGGGPVAARLAMAGHKTLLIEAGDDQGQNVNYSVPAYSAKASEDPALSWNFFVHHYADDERQALDYKTTYETPDGTEYTGLNPPPGSTLKGTLYPRTGALGGCTAHNALVAIYPFESDFEYVATLTGDGSWAPNNMRKYFINAERNNYLSLSPGHGYNGWLQTEEAPLTLVLEDTQLLSMITGGLWALGNWTSGIFNLATLGAGDANADSLARDQNPGYYQIPISSKDSVRVGSRDFVVDVRDAKNADGSKKYPLDVRTDCFATKVLFDESVSPPRATGVEFLDGKYLFKASPRSGETRGTPGSVTASREVIVSGGVYNSPMLLKHSGIGPRDELEKFGIPVVADLPGVGSNLQDHYEISVQGTVPENFTLLDGCTFTSKESTDPCLKRWENPVLGNRGTYASDGFASTMFFKSSATADENWDVFVFGGPVGFRGYFPGYSINITARHDVWSWAILKSHPRNTAGKVSLRSADPLDLPHIVFNYFDTGSGDYAADLQALYETVELARDAIARQPLQVEEILPGAGVKSAEDIKDYAKNTAWGHHASCTCPIGADDDPMAVLDSKFQVRGVKGLRVVDASVYPRIPGTFTAVSTYMVGEKAADIILEQFGQTSLTDQGLDILGNLL